MVTSAPGAFPILSEQKRFADYIAERCDVDLNTVNRWFLKGVRGRDGVKHKLESVRVGGRRVTSVEALERFLRNLDGQSVQQPIETPAQRQRAVAAADRETAEQGI